MQNGYPALDCKFENKDGSFFTTRFIIQGPHYYSLIAHSRQENLNTKNFFGSFEIKPFVYGSIKERRDTALYYTVKSPVFPQPKKEKIDFGNSYDYLNRDDDEGSNEKDILEKGAYRNSVIEDVLLHHSLVGNDATIRGMSQTLNLGDDTEIDMR